MSSRAPALPALSWIRGYERSWLSRDIVGGLSAGAVVIPQAMAYATIANLPVEIGLYTCMVPMLVYALIGGSRTLSVSTTSTIAVLTASTLLAAGVASTSDDPAGDLAMLMVLIGVILLVARVFRLGSIVDNISEATLTGIKVGVGLTVAADQLPKLLGIPGDPDGKNFFDHMRAVIDQLGDISVATAVFSAVTLAVLLGLRRFAPRVPAPLVVVAGGIALVAEVPSGLPTPVVPSFDHVRELLPGAFAIAIMAFLETVSVARNVWRSSEPPIDNDSELLANGVSALAGAFFRAMPPAGGFSQTAINVSAGARTQLSELVTVVLAVACALFLGGVLSDLPQATLGCLVIVAVIGLIRPSEFVRFYRLSRIDFWVAVITAVSGLVLGLLAAVLVGVVLTLFLVLRALDRLGITELQPNAAGDDVLLAGPDTVPVDGLMILRVDGPLYTANVRSVNRKILAATERRPGIDVVVLDQTAMAGVPMTVIDENLVLNSELAGRGVELWVAAVQPSALEAARKLPGWREAEANGRVHQTSLSALRAYLARDARSDP